jgi:hypothetical protein
MARKFGVNVPPHARRAVAWYSPTVLWESARQLFSSVDFQRNADRRDTFAAKLHVIDLSTGAQPDGSFGFDFVSDTGDSGNATYAVACAAQAAVLHAQKPDNTFVHLPEGRLLILGGDLAYPSASVHDYQYRFSELFEAAQDPASVFGKNGAPRKVIASIAQNHDWFDSLSTFNRYFLRKYSVLGHALDPKTRQTQSYFAVKLPHNWWVLGFDFALTHDLDGQQLDAFKALLRSPVHIAPGDKLILVYPEPYWTRPLGDHAFTGYPKRYQRLESAFEQAGARICMRIAGDLHHYVRQSIPAAPGHAGRDQLVTCGTGGAFMHPTHARKVVGARAIERGADEDALGSYRQGRVRVGSVEPGRGTSRNEASFPAEQTSRAFARQNLLAFFKRGYVDPALPLLQRLAQTLNSNFGFALFLGAMYWFNAYVNSLPFSASFRADGFKPMCELGFLEAVPLWIHAMVFSPFGFLMNLLLVAACGVIAREEGRWGFVGGVLHGLAHGVLVFAGYWLMSHWVANAVHGHWFSLANCGVELQSTWRTTAQATVVGVLTLVWGVIMGGLLFGAYLWMMAARGRMANNAFSSLGIEDYKGFMRFRLDAQGKLVARFLGVARVPRGWKRHDDPAHRPLWTPQEPPQWRVIDEFELD